MKRRKAITIRDVATAAKLSPTAVSRYLNRDMILPSESAARINEAVRVLDYHPDRLARNLSTGSSRLIGLVIPEISNPFFADLASAVEDVASKADYGVLLCNTHNDPNRELRCLGLLRTRQLDGIVYLTSHANNPELLAMLARNERVVLIDEDVVGISAPRVFCENRAGGYSATKHLLEHGHIKIAFIGGPEKLLSSRERFAGFKNALGEKGITPVSRFVRFGPYIAEYGRAIADEFLMSKDPPSAIFAASDYVALGVLNAAQNLGITIPKDLSLVGFDDMPFAALLSPPLTTVRQPIREMGEAGINFLLQLIKGEMEEMPVLRLPVQFIARSSVQVVPSRIRKRSWPARTRNPAGSSIQWLSET
jgi:LacI family transcriptional regulator, galactose operon repressor